MKNATRTLVKLAMVLALVAVIGVGTVFAAEVTNGKRFADANNDGVCDNMVENCCIVTGSKCNRGENFVDADNDGVCDNVAERGGEGQGNRGENYVDADNDGVCDNAAERGGKGQGNGQGRRGCTGN